jgi:hypothetical protein
MMAGSTGPVTLSGLMALQNAETLAAVVLAQLVNAGVPVIYGGTSSITDMKTGSLSIGAPEMSMIQHMQVQIAKSLLFDFNDYDIKVSAPEWKSFCGRHGLHDKTKFLDSSIVESNLLVFKAVPGSCNAIGLQVLYFR